MSENEDLYDVILGSQWQRKQFPTAADAWDWLVETLDNYLSFLEEEDLTPEHAEWDMFRDKVRAESLKPWVLDSRIEGPDGTWYGVGYGEDFDDE